MPIFVCLARYLDVLAIPPKFISVDLKAGIVICETYKKNQNIPLYLNLCL